jgi:hypothetical protein
MVVLNIHMESTLNVEHLFEALILSIDLTHEWYVAPLCSNSSFDCFQRRRHTNHPPFCRELPSSQAADVAWGSQLLCHLRNRGQEVL